MSIADQSARDDAINNVSLSTALSAGAGSGKTSVLVGRVVALLAAGVSPSRVAAITFTEKAAGEMEARLRDALEERVAAGNEHLRAPLARLSELTVSTIHAFCQRLLEAEALAAGWAPDSSVGEEGLDDVAFARWFEGLRARQPAVARLALHLVESTSIRSAGSALLNFRDLDPVVSLKGWDTDSLFFSLQASVQRAVSAMSLCTNPSCKLLTKNKPDLDLLVAILKSPKSVAVAQAAAIFGDIGHRAGGRKADWKVDGKADLLEAVDELRRWQNGVRVALHAALVSDLKAYFVPSALAARTEAAVASFDDLLFRAKELLEDADVRRRLSCRFDALLIDEVQDTDPIQAAIVELLCQDAGDEALRAGSLFAVGDAKQSIYRFRRADERTWGTVVGMVAKDGQTLSLTQNFRSVPGLVEFVNCAFEDMPDYAPQNAFRGAGPLEPVVLLSGLEDEAEAEVVARYLLAKKAAGAEVVDRDTNKIRALGWGDVMIVLPSWTHAGTLQTTLSRAGIPCLLEGGGGLFERDEARLYLAALKALDEPGHGEATVLVLRGLFGLDHEALARHVHEGGSWRYTVGEQPPGPVATALRALRALHLERGRRSFVALVDAVLERSGAAAVWSLAWDGAARLANWDKLRALTWQYEETCLASGEVVRAMVEHAKKDESELGRADVDSDAVRITSYFKAKGLEAPMVIACYARRTAKIGSAIVDRDAQRLFLTVGKLQPPGWDEAKIAEKAEDARERRRWMYVACTRARDQLVLVRSTEKQSALIDSYVTGPWPGGTDGELVTLASGASVRYVDATQLAPLDEDSTCFGELDELIDVALDAERTGSTTVEPVVSSGVPSAISSAAADPTLPDRVAVTRTSKKACTRWRSVHELASRERVRRGSGVGVEGGILVHAVLERVDLRLEGEALRLAAVALLHLEAQIGRCAPELVSACQAVIDRILAHEVIARARRAPFLWREAPFTMKHRGMQVSGIIDLCFPVDESLSRWVVVDWKSDLPPKGSPGWRNYQRQLGFYARALLGTVAADATVETLLVGPHAELGAPDALEVALEEMPTEIAEYFADLVARGVPIPEVGVDAGEPRAVVAELVWRDERIAVLLDEALDEESALRAQGWRVLNASTVTTGWALGVLQWIAEVLL